MLYAQRYVYYQMQKYVCEHPRHETPEGILRTKTPLQALFVMLNQSDIWTQSHDDKTANDRQRTSPT